MHVGIITFHESNNYGAILQAIALRNKLSQIFGDAEIIDYKCKNKQKKYTLLNLSRHKSFSKNMENICDLPYAVIRSIKINSSKSRLYKLTPKTYSKKKELLEDASRWDFVICGSDQIWNYKNTGFDTSYLLDFIESRDKKISYAASFGVNKLDMDEKKKDKYKYLLSQIAYLSVREESGKDIVRDLTGMEAEVVLDPTLLYDKSYWLKFKKENNYKGKYILLYTIFDTQQIKMLAELLKQKTGIPVIKIAVKIKDFFSTIKAAVPSIEEYVGLIADAEYIITDSFHGTIFAVNLNKNFYSLLRKAGKTNDRIIGILKTFGLENRIIYDDFTDIDLTPIDYSDINIIIEEQRTKSINFLKKPLKNKYKS